METFPALLAICAGNSPASGEFPAQRPVMRSFDVFFDLCLNKRLRKQSWGWWFKTPSRQLWRHCNDMSLFHFLFYRQANGKAQNKGKLGAVEASYTSMNFIGFRSNIINFIPNTSN